MFEKYQARLTKSLEMANNLKKIHAMHKMLKLILSTDKKSAPIKQITGGLKIDLDSIVRKRSTKEKTLSPKKANSPAKSPRKTNTKQRKQKKKENDNTAAGAATAENYKNFQFSQNGTVNGHVQVEQKRDKDDKSTKILKKN